MCVYVHTCIHIYIERDCHLAGPSCGIPRSVARNGIIDCMQQCLWLLGRPEWSWMALGRPLVEMGSTQERRLPDHLFTFFWHRYVCEFHCDCEGGLLISRCLFLCSDLVLNLYTWYRKLKSNRRIRNTAFLRQIQNVRDKYSCF